MITIETERLTGKSELEVVDGKVKCPEKHNKGFDLCNLKPATGMEQGFMFYLKEKSEIEVCHIGITYARNKFEITYGAETEMRNQGYMTEAVAGFLEWLFSSTEENEVWGFVPVGNDFSQRVLENNGFVAGEIESHTQWFVRLRGMME